MDITNKIIVLVVGSVECEIPPSFLKPGNTFKLYEKNGKPVNAGQLFTATSEPKQEGKTWKIAIKGDEHDN